MSSYLAEEQVRVLKGAIRPGRVSQDPRGNSHVEAYEIRAHLIRVFSYARWSSDVLQMQLVYEDQSERDGKPRWNVCYRAQLRLTVCAPDGNVLATYTEWATGDATNQPSRADAHDNALKTAESQALKRCAMNLGDQFGLSLYRRGSKEALVRQLVVNDPSQDGSPVASVDEHVTEAVPESEAPDPEPDTHEQSSAPTETPDVDAKQQRVADLTAQLHAAGTRAAVSGIAMQVSKERLHQALTYDLDENALTLGALVDGALKRVARKGAA